MNLTVNQNVATCLRDVTNLGSTTVYNVCTGTHTTVPWGAADWGAAALISVFIAGAAVLIISIILAFLRGVFS